jgi:hypothetical protein
VICSHDLTTGRYLPSTLHYWKIQKVSRSDSPHLESQSSADWGSLEAKSCPIASPLKASYECNESTAGGHLESARIRSPLCIILLPDPTTLSLWLQGSALITPVPRHHHVAVCPQSYRHISHGAHHSSPTNTFSLDHASLS